MCFILCLWVVPKTENTRGYLDYEVGDFLPSFWPEQKRQNQKQSEKQVLIVYLYLITLSLWLYFGPNFWDGSQYVISLMICLCSVLYWLLKVRINPKICQKIEFAGRKNLEFFALFVINMYHHSILGNVITQVKQITVLTSRSKLNCYDTV